jgi:hypothetical protein
MHVFTCLASSFSSQNLWPLDTKVSYLPGSSTPRVRSPVLTVNREPKMVLVQMPKGVFPILKLRSCLSRAE